MDRDMNAARNIHDRAFAVTEPGRGFRREALQRQTSTTREADA
jgi:transposase